MLRQFTAGQQMCAMRQTVLFGKFLHQSLQVLETIFPWMRLYDELVMGTRSFAK